MIQGEAGFMKQLKLWMFLICFALGCDPKFLEKRPYWWKKKINKFFVSFRFFDTIREVKDCINNLERRLIHNDDGIRIYPQEMEHVLKTFQQKVPGWDALLLLKSICQKRWNISKSHLQDVSILILPWQGAIFHSYTKKPRWYLSQNLEKTAKMWPTIQTNFITHYNWKTSWKTTKQEASCTHTGTPTI